MIIYYSILKRNIIIIKIIYINHYTEYKKMRSSRIRKIANNSKKIESNMMEYIKKLENKSVSSKINANKYLKENKREKAKSQLKRKNYMILKF